MNDLDEWKERMNRYMRMLRSLVVGVGVAVLLMAIFGPVHGAQRVQMIFASLIDFGCVAWTFIYPRIFGK
jgi:putative flippase GtrA